MLVKQLALGLLCVASCLAQARTGTISGQVTDPYGAPLRGIAVRARSATGPWLEGVTSADGRYTLTKLPFGTYTVVVPPSGFTFDRFERPSVEVRDAKTVGVDVRLNWSFNLGTPGDDQSPVNLPGFVRQRGPSPRTAWGRPDLSGVWIGDGDPDPEQPQLLPWAEEEVQKRIATAGRDGPSLRCLPPFVVPAGSLAYKFVQTPQLLVTLFENVPGFRQVYLDGRPHPADPNPTWMGHSIGRWERNTLVIDTVGFNDLSWFEIFPHTEKLHVVERYTRKDKGTLEVEVTIEDPGTFVKPWKRKSVWLLSANDDVYEYVCAENNKDPEHMR